MSEAGESDVKRRLPGGVTAWITAGCSLVTVLLLVLDHIPHDVWGGVGAWLQKNVLLLISLFSSSALVFLWSAIFRGRLVPRATVERRVGALTQDLKFAHEQIRAMSDALEQTHVALDQTRRQNGELSVQLEKLTGGFEVLQRAVGQG